MELLMWQIINYYYMKISKRCIEYMYFIARKEYNELRLFQIKLQVSIF